MTEKELETKRIVIRGTNNNKRINELKHWFMYMYASRLNNINGYKYFKLIPSESLDSLQLEWYDKKQELNSLLGLPPLADIQRINLIGGNK